MTPSSIMAIDIPLPIKLVLLSAPEALLVKQFIPEQNLRVPITPIVLTLIGINFFVWVFYRVLIYPFFFSPFRGLPEALVCVLLFHTCHPTNQSSRNIPSFPMARLSCRSRRATSSCSGSRPFPTTASSDSAGFSTLTASS